MTLSEWQKKTAGISLGVSVLFTISFIYPIYWYPVGEKSKSICEFVNYATWVLFSLDYIYQLILSSDKRKFISTHIFQLLVVALPFWISSEGHRGQLSRPLWTHCGGAW